MFRVLWKTIATSKGDSKEGVGTVGLIKRCIEVFISCVKTTAVPVLTGIILYLPVDVTIVRYCTAAGIILTW
jgi:hypothetical protein